MTEIVGFSKKINSYKEKMTIVALIIIGAIVIGLQTQELRDFFGKVAGLMAFIAFIPYILSIIRRETRPSITTWWIWAVLGAMELSSYHSLEAKFSIWAPVAYALGPFVVAIISLKYGEWSRDKWELLLNIACFMGAAVGVIVWWKFTAEVAMFTFLIMDLAAALPTLKKSQRNPEEEDIFAWLITLSGGLLNLVAIESWDFAKAGYPVYVVIIYVAVVILLLRKRR